MVLYVVSPEGVQQTISTAPSEDEIEAAVTAQPWSDITFVVLEADVSNSIILSGSNADGIALVWFDRGKQLIADLRNPSEGIPILQSYLRGDREWISAVLWE